MNNPLISVLIPTYNVEKYVEEAIRSIMNQTYQNLEIIVVDDGSSDRTFSILEALAKEDNRLKVFKNERNKRIVETLNTAISLAQGEYFARMDGDDVSLPNRIEEQYNFLLSRPDISLVGLNVIMIDENGIEIHKERYLSDNDAIREAARYVSPIPHFWLAKRELYEKVGNYRIPSAEDLDFILRTIDCGFKVANLPSFLYLQRIRRGNTATAMGLFQKKSIAYVRKLHAERQNNSLDDSYSFEGLKKALRINRVERILFDTSSYFHYRYIDCKSKARLLSLFYRGFSVLLSPKLQMLEVKNRSAYKRLLNQYNS